MRSARGHRRRHPHPHRDRGPRCRVAAAGGRRPRRHRPRALRPRAPTSATCSAAVADSAFALLIAIASSHRRPRPPRADPRLLSRAYIDFAAENPELFKTMFLFPPGHRRWATRTGEDLPSPPRRSRLPAAGPRRGHRRGRHPPRPATSPASRCGPPSHGCAEVLPWASTSTTQPRRVPRLRDRDHPRRLPRLDPGSDLPSCAATAGGPRRRSGRTSARRGRRRVERREGLLDGGSTTPGSATTASSHSGRTTVETVIGVSIGHHCIAWRTNSTA